MTKEGFNILVVSGSYPPDIGGSEASIGVACRILAKRGHRVRVVADDRRPKSSSIDGIQVFGVGPEAVVSTLQRLHEDDHFDVLLTQLVFSREALAWAASVSLPSVYFVRNAEMLVDVSSQASPTPTRLVASSRFISERIMQRWGRSSDVVHPLIDFAEVRSVSTTGSAITLINPIRIKGGDLLRELAIRFPLRSFIAVDGWTGLRRRGGDGGWDPKQWKLMAFAHDDPGLHPPEEVDFSDLPNVLHLPPTPDIREVYGQTRILLFPALWDEAFGRAVLEALANGIPVLATRAGGITETGLHFGGAFFDRDSGMEAWATEILRLDSPDAYSHACAMALEEIRWYNLNAEIAHLEAIIGDCIERRGLPW